MTLYALYLKHAIELDQFKKDRDESFAKLQIQQLDRYSLWVRRNSITIGKLRAMIEARHLWKKQWEDGGTMMMQMKARQQKEIHDLMASQPTTEQLENALQMLDADKSRVQNLIARVINILRFLFRVVHLRNYS